MSELLPQPLSPGEVVLDRYRAIEHIATGGHSAVYRGRDERLARPVCIKVFSRFPGDPGISQTSYEHFVQEAFALSRLTHPNTLRIYDFGHLPGEDPAEDGPSAIPFHVSEFMNGGTLSQLVRERGPQPVNEALKVAVAICDALHEAHSVGIIHRDLKPQNILFAALGTTRLAKLADFGIAKWLEHEVSTTERLDGLMPLSRAGDTQVVSGQRMAMYSPSWAAPEQLAGQPLDHSADIYSMALLVVYMLTGRAIFAEEDVYEGYRKRKSADLLLRMALEPLGLAESAIELLAHALSFEPSERPQDVGNFAVALADSFEPITGQPGKLEATPVPVPVSTSSGGSGASRQLPLPPHPPQLSALEASSPTAAERPPARAAARATRRLSLTTSPTQIAGRTARFAVTHAGSADVAGLNGVARLRLTLMPPMTGRPQIHVKGMTCFVAKQGGRPSMAVSVDQEQMLDLIGANNAKIGRVRIAVGTPAAGHTMFRFGDEQVAIGLEECPEVVLADFGAGAECAFVHTPGVAPDDARGKHKRSRT